MSSPNNASFATIDDMAREYESTGFALRECTKAKAIQLRATLAALRKEDDRWWNVKLQDEVARKDGRVIMQVRMVAQDEWRLAKMGLINARRLSAPQRLATPAEDKRAEVLFRQPNGFEWRDKWDYELELQERLHKGESEEEIRKHIAWKKEQINDPAKRKAYFEEQAKIYWREVGQDPGELDPRLTAGAEERERIAAEAVVQKERRQKRETSQEMFDRLFKPRPGGALTAEEESKLPEEERNALMKAFTNPKSASPGEPNGS